MSRFAVERVDPLRLEGEPSLDQHELISPAVWRMPDGRLGILVRVVPGSTGDDRPTGSIWYGEGSDGLVFRADDRPVLMPDAGGLDSHGCEDPTVILRADGEIIVYYTGVDDNDEAHLLWASGREIHALNKRGVALHSFDGQKEIKEAEVATDGRRWLMGYEYSRDDASVLGIADGDGPEGPWREIEGGGFAARQGRWDSWHVSPGPTLMTDPDRPVMFYNGANRDAVWGIGWVEFDYRNRTVTERSEEPVIFPPGEDRGRNIAFAASLIDEGDLIHLYLSYNDRELRRAVVRRNG